MPDTDPNYAQEWNRIFAKAYEAAPQRPEFVTSKKGQVRKGYYFKGRYIPFSIRHAALWLQLIIEARNLEGEQAKVVYSNAHLAECLLIGTTVLNHLLTGLLVLGLITRTGRGIKRTTVTTLYYNPLPYDESRAEKPKRIRRGAAEEVRVQPVEHPAIAGQVEKACTALFAGLKSRGRIRKLPWAGAKYALRKALRECFAHAEFYLPMDSALAVFPLTFKVLFGEDALPELDALAADLLSQPDFCAALPRVYPEIFAAWRAAVEQPEVQTHVD